MIKYDWLINGQNLVVKNLITVFTVTFFFPDDGRDGTDATRKTNFKSSVKRLKREHNKFKVVVLIALYSLSKLLALTACSDRRELENSYFYHPRPASPVRIPEVLCTILISYDDTTTSLNLRTTDGRINLRETKRRRSDCCSAATTTFKHRVLVIRIHVHS